MQCSVSMMISFVSEVRSELTLRSEWWKIIKNSLRNSLVAEHIANVKGRHWTEFWVSSIHLAHVQRNFYYIHLNVILHSQSRYSSARFPRDFPTKTLCSYLFPHSGYIPSPPQPPNLNFTTQTISAVLYKSPSSSLCTFPNYLLNSPLLGLNILHENFVFKHLRFATFQNANS